MNNYISSFVLNGYSALHTMFYPISTGNKPMHEMPRFPQDI